MISLRRVNTLFSEYTQMLVDNDPAFGEYLAIQNYEEELKHLREKYGMPEGRLYLAYCGGQLAGCIGLGKIDDVRCEMKRLYVRPEFRGEVYWKHADPEDHRGCKRNRLSAYAAGHTAFPGKCGTHV